jgi:tellurite resistance protein TehA-like permease
MLFKVIWEAISIGLLLYGLYLVYVFIWFSIVRIWDTDVFFAKAIAFVVIGILLIFPSVKWFRKKFKELKELKENPETVNSGL